MYLYVVCICSESSVDTLHSFINFTRFHIGLPFFLTLCAFLISSTTNTETQTFFVFNKIKSKTKKSLDVGMAFSAFSIDTEIRGYTLLGYH